MESFEEFKERKKEEDPELRRVSDAYLRNMYESESETSVSSSSSEDAHVSSGGSYSTLRGVAKFVSAIGWAVVIFAVLGGIIVGTILGEGAGGLGGGLIGGMALSTLGVLIVVQGQLFSCIVDIQRNTERMVSLMEEE